MEAQLVFIAIRGLVGRMSQRDDTCGNKGQGK
jgi:hypothetical protein